MSETKSSLLKTIHQQIREKTESLGSPTLHTFEDGSTYLHFFDQWEEIEDMVGVKSVQMTNVGDVPNDKKIQIVFSKKGTHVPLRNFHAKKTYIVMRGKVNFFFEEKEDILLTQFTTTVIPKGMLHGGDTLEDSFVIIIEDDCDLPLF